MTISIDKDDIRVIPWSLATVHAAEFSIHNAVLLNVFGILKNQKSSHNDKTATKKNKDNSINSDYLDKTNNKDVELDVIKAPNIKSQDDWEKVIVELGFEGAAKMLVKNTLFNSLVDSTLKLTLNNEFMNLLTKNTKNSIEKTLSNFYSDLTLFIESGETNGSTLSQKESTKLEKERKKTEEQFLNDDGLKELEETFNTKVDTKSIKSLKETKNV